MPILKIYQIKDRNPNELLPLPQYQSEGASGLDLIADVNGYISPNERVLVHTGIIVELPIGYEGQVRSRSGLALKHGIVVLNSPGTIDQDYRGEIGVILINHSENTFWYVRGDRIAQLVIVPVCKVEIEQINLLNSIELSGRGASGWGSTGQ